MNDLLWEEDFARNLSKTDLIKEIFAISKRQLICAQNSEWNEFFNLGEEKGILTETFIRRGSSVTDRVIHPLSRQLIDTEYQIWKIIEERKASLQLQIRSVKKRQSMFQNTLLKYREYSGGSGR